eukprot:13649462-Alexandrium_andersonii.AAC.1
MAVASFFREVSLPPCKAKNFWMSSWMGLLMGPSGARKRQGEDKSSTVNALALAMSRKPAGL